MSVLGRVFVPLVFIAFSVLFIANIYDMTYREKIFPYLSIMLIFVLCFVVLVKDFMRSRHGAATPPVAGDADNEESPVADMGSAPSDFKTILGTWKLPAITVLFMCLYVYATPRIGFYVSTFIFLVATSAITGIPMRKVPLMVAAMLATTVASYFFFTYVLQIYLP